MDEEEVIISITIDDDDVLKAEKRFEELSDTIEDLTDTLKRTRNANKDYQKQLDQIDKDLKAKNISVKEAAKLESDLNKKIATNNKEIAKTGALLSDAKRERKQNLNLMQSEVDTLNQLKAKRNLLNREINETNTKTEEGRKQYKKLESQLKDVNEEINDASKNFGNFKENIGNYTESINESRIGMSGLIDGMDTMGGAASSAGGKMKDLNSIFSLVAKNPLIAVIAALVATFKLLWEAFKQSETGAKIIRKAMAGLDALFGVVVKVVDIFAKTIVWAFKNPLDAIKSFGKFIKDQIYNRVEGLIDLFVGTFEYLGATIRFFAAKVKLWLSDVPIIGGFIDAESAQKDLDRALSDMEKSTRKLGNAVGQIFTGLDSESLSGVFKAMDKFIDQTAEASMTLGELNARMYANKKAAREVEKSISRVNAEMEIQRAIADDGTKSLKQQAEAAQKASAIAQKASDMEINLAQKNLNLINEKIKLYKEQDRAVDDLLDEQLDAETQVIEKRNEAILLDMELAKQKRQIERDLMERRLDILIDGFDKIKTINENIISSDESTFEEKRKILDQTVKLGDDSYKAQLDQMSNYVTDYSQLSGLIAIQDATVLQKRINNIAKDDTVAGRLLEIVKERQQAIRDFDELSFELDADQRDRDQAASERIKELEDDKEIAAINRLINTAEKEEQSASETIKLYDDLKNKLIEIEQEKSEALLANETLTEQERKAIILETENEIQTIKDQFAEQENERDQEKIEKLESNNELVSEKLSELAELTSEFAGEEAAIFGNLTNDILTYFDNTGKGIENTLNTIKGVSESVFGFIDARNARLITENQKKSDKEIAELEKRKETDIESAGESAEAKEAIEMQYDTAIADLQTKAADREKQLKLKQFRAEKASALVSIGISTALAVIKAAAALPVPPFPFSIAVGALGAVQAGIVASKSPPEFAKGGQIVDAGDHGSGDDMIVYGETRRSGKKQIFGAVQGNEMMAVFNRDSTEALMASKFNQQHGGNSFSSPRSGAFADGGQINTGANIVRENISIDDVLTIASSIKNVVKIEDITTAINNKIEVVDNANI